MNRAATMLCPNDDWQVVQPQVTFQMMLGMPRCHYPFLHIVTKAVGNHNTLRPKETVTIV